MSTFTPNQLNNIFFLLLFNHDSAIEDDILANIIKIEQKSRLNKK